MINQFRVRENGVVLPLDSPTMLFPGINTQRPLSPSGLTELAFALNVPGTSMMILRAPTTRLPSVDVSSLRSSPSTHSLLTSLRQEQGRKLPNWRLVTSFGPGTWMTLTSFIRLALVICADLVDRRRRAKVSSTE